MAGFTLDATSLRAAVAGVKSAALRDAILHAAASAVRGRAEASFRNPSLRVETWPPRSKRTDQRIGAASKGAAAARAKAKKFRREAVEQDYASVWLEGKKRDRARAKAAKAAAKAKEWRGKAREAAAKAVANRQLLIDTGNLMSSFAVGQSGEGYKVFSSAPYAEYHQFGTSRMPRRPMLPFDEAGNLAKEAEADILAMAGAGLARALAALGFEVRG